MKFTEVVPAQIQYSCTIQAVAVVETIQASPFTFLYQFLINETWQTSMIKHKTTIFGFAGLAFHFIYSLTYDGSCKRIKMGRFLN